MSAEEAGNSNEIKEKGWASKTTWGTDRLEAIGWGIFFIWIAVVVIIDITGYKKNFSWWNGWAIALTGGGIISIASGVIRAFVPRLRNKMMGAFIFGFIMLAVGWGAWGWFWVVALIAIAIAILAGALRRRH